MDQLLSAIAVVSEPTQDRELQQQAIVYLNTVRSHPQDSWHLALELFIAKKSDGTSSNDPQVRLFALQILDDFLSFQEEKSPQNPSTVEVLKSSFLTYIHEEFIHGAAESAFPYIRNKFSHTLALLFLSSYPSHWQDFFPTLYQFLKPSTPSQTVTPAFNPHACTLFLHLLIEISGEVADSILKGARDFSEARHQRDAVVRDCIRENDSKDISDVVLAIISETEVRLVAARNGVAPDEQGPLIDAISLSVRAFASLIPWINVNFTVTPDTLPLLFRLLSDPSLPIRVETANAFVRMIQKGLKEPSGKLQLIGVLSLGDIIPDLEQGTRGDEEQVQFREGLGKLTNALGLELCKLVEESTLGGELQAHAHQLQAQIFPVALRFLADEWDDVSITVHLFLTTVLAAYKRQKKNSPVTHMTEEKKQFLSSLLEIAFEKMKWDTDADPDFMDDDDRLSFDTMRKDLRTFADSVMVIDEQLVNSYVQSLALNTLRQFQSGTSISWQDAELAVYLVFLYGELQKTNKGPSQFVIVPPDVKAELKATIPVAKKPRVNYSQFPLTSHGELMLALVESNISSHPHHLVAMQFFEAIGRYGEFFRIRKECNEAVLTAFIDSRGIHTRRTELRGRLFYLFHRFIRDIRQEIPKHVVPIILNGIDDLLVLNIELPEHDSPPIDLLEAAVNAPSLFDSQLYLFETAGTLISLLSGEDEEQTAILKSITNPLLSALSEALHVQVISDQDILPILRVHHLVRALGNISKGFPDAPVPTPPNYKVPTWVPVFQQVAEAILVSLSTMSQYHVVREATRFAFSRIIASCGPATAKYIPSLLGCMLASCEPAELSQFIAFLGLVVFKLQFEIFDVLDEMVSPLHNHMASIASQPVDGTDAKVELHQTKKSYLDLLVTVMTGPLFIVFVSPRNKDLIESLVNFVLTIAGDTSDPQAQKIAWTVLARFTTHFGRSEAQAEIVAQQRTQAGEPPSQNHYIPGFEVLIYERLIPLAFEIPTKPGFSLKDAQTVQVLSETATFLAATRKARGPEALEFFSNVLLPSKGWPTDTISNFVAQLSTLDTKGFKKFWTDFVRSSMTATLR